jgi:uncharacterized protein YjcR
MTRYNKIIELYLNNMNPKNIAEKLNCKISIVEKSINKYADSIFNQILG